MNMRNLHSAWKRHSVATSVAFRMLLLCGAGVMLPQATFAAVTSAEQKEAITGVITDANTGESIIGASIVVKGTTMGCVTDIDGRFVLSVDKLPATIIVSYVGYQSKEVQITSRQSQSITLSEDSHDLGEVIVTGYGTFKKSAYAGSASNVKADKIADVPSVSFQDMLQGNATGVQFTSSSGQPGAAASINIRGMGSINAGNTPFVCHRRSAYAERKHQFAGFRFRT